jgi:hypothetical protein
VSRTKKAREKRAQTVRTIEKKNQGKRKLERKIANGECQLRRKNNREKKN